MSIAKNVLLLKKHIDDETLTKIENMNTLAISAFEDAIDSLFKHDFHLAENVINKTKEIAKLEKEAVLSSQKMGIEEIASLRLLIESVRRTAEYASDIAEIVLNLNIESVLNQHTSKTNSVWLQIEGLEAVACTRNTKRFLFLSLQLKPFSPGKCSCKI